VYSQDWAALKYTFTGGTCNITGTSAPSGVVAASGPLVLCCQ
jgi:hypothetical protein